MSSNFLLSFGDTLLSTDHDFGSQFTTENKRNMSLFIEIKSNQKSEFFFSTDLNLQHFYSP